MDIISYVLSRKYVDESIEGISGTLAGKNCTIQSVDKVDGVSTVTFQWTADDGSIKTSQMQVKDGDISNIVEIGSDIPTSKDNRIWYTELEEEIEVPTIQELASKINITDIVDNLTDESNDKPLSAKQGKILNDTKANTNDVYNKDAVDGFIDELKLFKFPNAVIHGEPIINNGQLSGFSTSNYLVLPSVFNLSGRGFEFKFAFTTKDDVTTAQNILGGKFCMALFIQNGKLNLRVSSNGTNWNLVNIEGSTNIEANKTYYAKINFTRLYYTLSLSTDDETYNEIGSANVGDISPYPSELYIGIGNNFHNPFKGIINLNKCYLKVNNSIVWQGMDDAGLATRLATDLDNIDDEGIEAIKEIIATENYTKIDDNVVSTDTTWSSEKITDVSSQLSESITNIYNSYKWNIKDINMWEFLNINDNNGLNDDYNGYSGEKYWIMRTKGFIFGKNLLLIMNKTNKVNYKVYRYNLDGSFIDFNRYDTKEYIELDKKYMYRILLFIDTRFYEQSDGYTNLTDFLNEFLIECYSDNNYMNYSWNAIGDSITEGDQGSYFGFPLDDKALYFERIKSMLHMDSLNCGLGGTTIALNNNVDPSRIGKSFVERICGLNGNTPYRNADLITIMGGANDILYNSEIGSINNTSEDIDTVYGAVKKICEYLQSLSNNPKIIWFSDPYTNYFGEYRERGKLINKAIKDVCEIHGITYYDLESNCGISFQNISKMTYDNIHPNPIGTSMFIEKIKNVIVDNI